MDTQSAILQLHATLVRRDTPEAVAELIESSLAPAWGSQLRLLLQARRSGSIKRFFGWSSMRTVFQAPTFPARQLAKARELALHFLDGSLPQGDEPAEVEQLLNKFNALIGKTRGADSFRNDRLNRERRLAVGLRLSRRRYGKLFRLASRLENRLATLRREEAKHRLVLIGKAGLASDLSVEQFCGHLPSAAFVAYYAARTKLRSEFTISGQQKPFDDLADALLSACADDPNTSWFPIAHVFPRADVLRRLTEEQKGALLGRWFDILNETAERLEQTYLRTSVDLSTMIVRRGNDSTTWNLLASAWNRARDHWIALVEALGMGALLDEMLPGKVMRLMAADVAAWHRSAGGDVHPDTKVWGDLPRPWEVLRLQQPCNRQLIEAVCARHGIDPVQNGWVTARARTAVEEFRPTPELVHGVDAKSPYFAAVLRRIGAFSGRPLKLGELRRMQDD